MGIGLVGKKCGMTRVFTEEGTSIPVTVIQVLENRVSQVKTTDNDGYRAIQVATGTKKVSRVNKATAGHFAKAGMEAAKYLIEFRLGGEDKEFKIGDMLSVDTMVEGQLVDVTGQSKGKGFAGAVKRHHFAMQDATHGNSISHRAPGSIGQCQTPGRVFKGKKMAGHLGSETRTIQNLKVVRVDAEKGLLLIKGAVPGAISGKVIVNKAVKAK